MTESNMEPLAIPKDAKPHMKLVIIGRTGAGKTTLINSIVNHFYGVEFGEERAIAISQALTLRDPRSGEEIKINLKSNIEQFKNKQSDAGGSQSASQTSKPNIYDLENAKFKLTLIDTPGLGDTGGIETDKLHCKNICTAVAALSDFNAIVLVHKANDCRKDVLLAYLITEFKSMLPRGCENSFLICFTSAVNKLKIDAIPVIKEMGLPITNDNYFAFENDSLTPPLELLRVCGIEYPFKNEADEKRAHKVIKFPFEYWNENKDEFTAMLQKAQTLTPLPGKSFVEISNKKDILIKMVQRHADTVVTLQDEAKRQAAQLQRLSDTKKTMDDNQNYLSSGIRQVKKQKTVKVKKFVDKPLPGGKSTQCMTCKNICHPDCGLDQIYTQGHLALKGCAAFSGDNCHKCHHDYTVHTHTNVIREEVEEDQTEDYFEPETYNVTDHNKQTLFEQAKNDVATIQAEVQRLSALKVQKDAEIQSAYTVIAFLHKQLSDSTICSHNEYFMKYIEYRKQLTQNSPKLSRDEIQKEMALLDRAEREYTATKHFVEKATGSPLTPADKAMIEAEYKRIEAEQAAIIDSYRGDRRSHNINQHTRRSSITIPKTSRRD